MKTPINNGLAQSDLDLATFKLLRANLGDYAGIGLNWNPLTGKLDANSGGGATPITVNVQAPPYNATGDGVTDDTAAIQAAINDVCGSAVGGTVYLPGGTYLCNGVLQAGSNSVLKIPWRDTVTQPTIPFVLQGASPGVWVSPTFLGTGGSRIISRRIGTGNGPAILAAGPYIPPVAAGGALAPISAFNQTNVTIRDLNFRCAENPTLWEAHLRDRQD
jgi:hypothetical protein